MRRRTVVLLVVLSLSLALSSCSNSNSSSTKNPPQNPVFTSTAPAAAAQGVAYSYTLAATDPSGGSVSFALTTGPTGASITGNALSWTPTAAQSRTSNSFTITATTSEGASATQTFSVTPTGIVTVNAINTYWEPNGPVQIPITAAESLAISAVVPQSDGSILVLKGSTTSPGVISIAGVPAGNYWLAAGGTEVLPNSSSAFWTNASTFDIGRDIAGFPPAVLNANEITNFTFNVSSLDSVNTQTPVVFIPETQGISLEILDAANSTTLSQSFGLDSDIDWSKVSTAFLTQFVPGTLGPLTTSVLGPATELNNLTLTNGGTNTITQALGTTPASLAVTVQGSQWQSAFTGAYPSTVTAGSYTSGFSLWTEPFVANTVNAPAPLRSSNVVYASTVPLPATAFNLDNFANCDGVGFLGLLTNNDEPAITTDGSLGTLSYNDPFPSGWTRAETFCQEAILPMPFADSTDTQNFSLSLGETIAPSATALTPMVGPVQSPMINGASLYTAATLNTQTPSLSWTAPATGTPTSYRVAVSVETTVSGRPTYASAGVFNTSQTSITLPPLSAGNNYVFAILSLVDSAGNVQTAPNRSALPTAFASVVSAPITVSASATVAQIHGDARIVRRFSQPVKPSSPK